MNSQPNFTKQALYDFLEITSMSASGDATEWHGKRGIKWFKSEIVET